MTKGPIILGLTNSILNAALKELVKEVDWEPIVRKVLKNEEIDSPILLDAVLASFNPDEYEIDASIYVYKKDPWEERGDAMVASFN